MEGCKMWSQRKSSNISKSKTGVVGAGVGGERGRRRDAKHTSLIH